MTAPLRTTKQRQPVNTARSHESCYRSYLKPRGSVRNSNNFLRVLDSLNFQYHGCLFVVRILGWQLTVPHKNQVFVGGQLHVQCAIRKRLQRVTRLAMGTISRKILIRLWRFWFVCGIRPATRCLNRLRSSAPHRNETVSNNYYGGCDPLVRLLVIFSKDISCIVGGG
jgi:hypothetical protein